MTTTTEAPTTVAPAGRRGRWIDDWNPDDEVFWATTGKRIARRNLIFSIFAEHLGFAIWVLWSVVVLSLANAGLPMSLSEAFWLTAIPNLVGSALRIPYTFAVPRFGGRLWTVVSASLLLVPSLLLAFLVPSGFLADQSHDTQFWVLLVCAATAGVGGGNFSSSMANISFFYPERRKGLALGLNAAGGNLGVAVVQLVVPLVVIIGVPAGAAKLPRHEVHLAYAGLIWIPFAVIAALCAWFFMDSLTQARADTRSYVTALRHGQTWVMSVLYIGTFGSFIGYSFALPLVIKNTFPEFLAANPFVATYLAGLGFIGALVGSVARPFGGWLSDRIGGARVTFACFVGMGAFTLLAMAGVNTHSFGLFFGSYLVIFLLSGAGNGSTYRMIPVIFGELGRREAAEKGLAESATALRFRREAAAVIGIAGAVGAFGGFLVQLVFRQASLGVTAKVTAADSLAEKQAVAAANQDWSTSALWVFLAAYAVFAFLTWFYYLRRRFAVDRVPSLAHAGV
ncbi:MFS transporter [Actinophytocola oryzae]|uniref:NNP family nitrate/nitrite transporter-like MFS transporter n=1 Tax=Actinophytocola oryzae TaxID=502181 RepID=A0A4R7VYB1_9PSEU|nr:MFS transporter [Actinophytocola oryzae]TDV55163.1 NNP family nitrate/nitrite transporter-like MFS transporter [Actinophytocola oryzae]